MTYLNRLLQQDADNTRVVTQQLVRLLKVPVTQTTINKVLKEHPDYPSLLSIGDSLNRWKIRTQALKVDISALDKLPVPFIAHTEFKNSVFVTVTKVDEKTIEYVSPTANQETISEPRERFIRTWSKVVLIAEADEDSGEPEYAQKRRKEWLEQSRFPILLSGLLLFIVLYGMSTSFNISGVLYAILLPLLKLTGCVTCGLLLWFEIDQNNPLLQKICSSDKNTNCKAVLQSKEARLFNTISWSEIGFFYFAGGLLYTLFSNNQSVSTINLLAWFNALSLPYVFFSVYYQARILRQWCPLCLVVQALLVIEALYFFLDYWQSNTWVPILTLVSFSTCIISFGLPVLLWIVIKPFLRKAQQADFTRIELAKFKYNQDIFTSQLEKQPLMAINPDGLGITLGNPHAPYTLTKVCNPYCGPCAQAHTAIEELLDTSDQLKVQIIFTASNEETDRKNKPVRHLLAIHEKKNERLIKKALDDWYLAPIKEYDAFAAKYPMNGELQQQAEKIEAMYQWCTKMKIPFTPSYFLNGRPLPAMYSIQDLRFLLQT